MMVMILMEFLLFVYAQRKIIEKYSSHDLRKKKKETNEEQG